VIGITGVLECFEQFCKCLRSPTVFRWTTSFTRHADLLKRFVSQQNFFKNQLVLPAVPKSYSYNNFAPIVSINSPSLVRFSSANLLRTLDLGSDKLCRWENKSMKMGIGPPHHRLQGPVEIAKPNITRN
jgi:hypothetical protein